MSCRGKFYLEEWGGVHNILTSLGIMGGGHRAGQTERENNGRGKNKIRVIFREIRDMGDKDRQIRAR